MQYWGFDLGDGESAVARVGSGENRVPEIVDIDGKKVVITVWAVMPNGMLRSIHVHDILCDRASTSSSHPMPRYIHQSMPTANAKGTATFSDWTISQLHDFTIIFAFPFVLSLILCIFALQR